MRRLEHGLVTGGVSAPLTACVVRRAIVGVNGDARGLRATIALEVEVMTEQREHEEDDAAARGEALS